MKWNYMHNLCILISTYCNSTNYLRLTYVFQHLLVYILLYIALKVEEVHVPDMTG